MVPCSNVIAADHPTPVGPIKVAFDDRTLVIDIAWLRPCSELNRVAVTNTPSEVDVAVYYGRDPRDPTRISPAPSAGSAVEVCPAAGQRRGFHFTAVRLAAPLAGRKIVDLGTLGLTSR
jgi:hypothetical protein